MNDMIPEKVYYLRMLNDNLLKQDESQFTVKNVRISPAGVLEADRIYSNVSLTTKVFYNGEFYLSELSESDLEDFYEHNHEDEE
jgi:hypothetical protein